jgi:hypothetical protein
MLIYNIYRPNNFEKWEPTVGIITNTFVSENGSSTSDATRTFTSGPNNNSSAIGQIIRIETYTITGE